MLPSTIRFHALEPTTKARRELAEGFLLSTPD
jgi:hypothetical protein